MPRLPDKVKVGQAVKAEDFNALLDCIAAGVPIAGAGLVARPSASGVTLSLASIMADWMIRSTITAVYGSRGDPMEDVKYDAVGVGRPDCVMQGATPRIGRPLAGRAACIPAQVGDPCIIIRHPRQDGSGYDAHLYILTEQADTVECDSGPGIQIQAPPRPTVTVGGRVITMDAPPPPPGGGSGTAGGGGSPSTGGGFGGSGES